MAFGYRDWNTQDRVLSRTEALIDRGLYDISPGGAGTITWLTGPITCHFLTVHIFPKTTVIALEDIRITLTIDSESLYEVDAELIGSEVPASDPNGLLAFPIADSVSGHIWISLKTGIVVPNTFSLQVLNQDATNNLYAFYCRHFEIVST